MVSENVTRHAGLFDADERARRIGQRGLVVWLTGLSGSGKSTVAVGGVGKGGASAAPHRCRMCLDHHDGASQRIVPGQSPAPP